MQTPELHNATQPRRCANCVAHRARWTCREIDAQLLPILRRLTLAKS
jgi:hypothetical protein